MSQLWPRKGTKVLGRLIKHYNLLGQIFFSGKPTICRRSDILLGTKEFVPELDTIKKELRRFIDDCPPPQEFLFLPKQKCFKHNHTDKQMDLLEKVFLLVQKVKPRYVEVRHIIQTMLNESTGIEKGFRLYERNVFCSHQVFSELADICDLDIAQDRFFLSRYRFGHAAERHSGHMKEIYEWEIVMAVRKRNLDDLIAFYNFTQSIRGVLDLNKEYVNRFGILECDTCHKTRLHGIPTYRCVHDEQHSVCTKVRSFIDRYNLHPSSDCLLDDLQTLAEELVAMDAAIKNVQAVLHSDYKNYLLPLQSNLHEKIKKREMILEASPGRDIPRQSD